MTGLSTKTRRAVRDRDGHVCRRCGRWGNNIHHRVGGPGKRPETLDALVTLCGSGTTGCHGWVTTHPMAACDSGWSIWSWETDPPYSIPMEDLWGRLFFLTEEGEVAPPHEF